MFKAIESRFEQNGENLRRMMARMNYDPLHAGEDAYAFGAAARRCAFCRQTIACSRWLDKAAPDAPPPSFCPNAFFWPAG